MSKSPTAAKPLAKKEDKKADVFGVFAIFTEEDIKASWPSMKEAIDVAEDAAEKHKKTMLIFRLVGTVK